MQFGIVCAIAAMAASFGCATSGSTDGAATAADAQAAKVNGAANAVAISLNSCAMSMARLAS